MLAQLHPNDRRRLAQWQQPPGPHLSGVQYGQVAKVDALNVVYDVRGVAVSTEVDVTKSSKCTGLWLCLGFLLIAGIVAGIGIAFLSNMNTNSPPLLSGLTSTLTSPPPLFSDTIHAPVCYESGSGNPRTLVSRCELVDEAHCASSMEAAYTTELGDISEGSTYWYRLCTTNPNNVFMYSNGNQNFTEFQFKSKAVECYRPIAQTQMLKTKTGGEHCDASWVTTTTAFLAHTTTPCAYMFKFDPSVYVYDMILLSDVHTYNTSEMALTSCDDINNLTPLSLDRSKLCLSAFEFPASNNIGQALRCYYDVNKQLCTSPMDLHVNTCFDLLPYDKSIRTQVSTCDHITLVNGTEAEKIKKCDQHYNEDDMTLCWYSPDNDKCDDSSFVVSGIYS